MVITLSTLETATGKTADTYRHVIRDQQILRDRREALARLRLASAIERNETPRLALYRAQCTMETASERCIRVARDCGRIANA